MRLPHVGHRRAIALLVTTALSAASATAQSPPTTSGRSGPPARCVDAIPSSAMSRVLAYVWAESADSAAGIRNSGGLIAESAGDRLRAMLGDSGRSVPRADGRLSWRQLDGSVHVVLRWNSGVAVASPSDSLADDTSSNAAPGNRAGIRMLADAVRAMAGERAVEFWPPNVTADSLVFDLHLVTVDVDRHGTAGSLTEAPAVPVFTLMQPWIEQVRVERGVAPEYPRGPRSENATGTVVLRFMVDTTGHADSSTVRDVWPSNRPRLAGSERAAYDAFYAAARDALLETTFAPLTVGGCRMRELVQQPFAFQLNR